MPSDKLAGRLVKVLERDRWDPKELPESARQLRDFADSLNAQKGGKNWGAQGRRCPVTRVIPNPGADCGASTTHLGDPAIHPRSQP
jgi:hypothetical protein